MGTCSPPAPRPGHSPLTGQCGVWLYGGGKGVGGLMWGQGQLQECWTWGQRCDLRSPPHTGFPSLASSPSWGPRRG